MRPFRERDDILQVKETADIQAAKELGKTGIILGFQNASPIQNELDRLGLFLALGVRIIQLTYHETNLLGSRCWERNDSGLSNFGIDAVREMNRLGIVIDLSHASLKTTIDAIEMAAKPVAITHVNALSFCDHRRNKEEEALKLLAEKGARRRCHLIGQLSAHRIRFDGRGFRRCHRRHGGADRRRSCGHRHRFHPRSAARILAFRRFPAGHEIPFDVCRRFSALHRTELSTEGDRQPGGVP